MPMHTLEPNATVTVGQWLTDQGNTSLHPRLVNEVTGYIRPSTSGQWLTGSFLTSWYIGFQDLPTLPTGARIFAVRWVWAAIVIGEGNVDMRTRLRHGGSNVLSDKTTVENISQNPVFYFEPWLTTRPGSSQPWEKSVVDGLQVSGSAKLQVSGPDATCRFVQLWLDVDVNLRPYVNVTSPGGTITDTAQPVIEWTYTDPEGDPQDAYRIRASIPGEPGLFTFDSGWITSTSARSYTMPVLPNGYEYRVDVQVRQQWSGSGEAPVSRTPNQGANSGESGQPFAVFTIDVQGPDQPSVVATPLDDEARIRVEVTPGPDPEVPTNWITIDYRDADGSGTWRPLRFGGPLSTSTDPVVVYDHEARFGVEREYRARAFADLPSGPVPGDPAFDSATIEGEECGWWITDVQDPSLFHAKVHRGADWVEVIEGREVVHKPAGMSVSVVESEPPVSRYEEVMLIADDAEERARLRALFRSTRTLLWRDKREMFYFRWVEDRIRTQLGPDTLEASTFVGTIAVVAFPSVPESGEPLNVQPL